MNEVNMEYFGPQLDVVEFEVMGTPIPQGSKSRTRWGGMREANPKTMEYRERIYWVGRDAMDGRPPLVGPCGMEVCFVMPRTTGHKRDDLHAVKPDLDKLLRCLGDGMTQAQVWQDDGRLSVVLAYKRYQRGTEEPGLQARVWRIGGPLSDGTC